MGQKINPLGFRLITTQKACSIWMINFKKYNLILKEDYKIRQYLLTQLSQNAHITKIIIKRYIEKNIFNITIYCLHPLFIIGENGITLQKEYSILKKLYNIKHIFITIQKIKIPDLDANLLALFIVIFLEKRITLARIIQKLLIRIQTVPNFLGLKIQVSGRINDAEMAKTEWFKEGRLPLQTIRANIDYAEKYAKTKMGILGIKMWLFKGEII